MLIERGCKFGGLVIFDHAEQAVGLLGRYLPKGMFALPFEWATLTGLHVDHCDLLFIPPP
jgi:hypothetical protein